MRRFNPEKELRKVQNGNRNKAILFVISLLVVGIIGYSFALYQVRYSKRIIYTKVAPFSNKDINILAIYLDDKPTDTFPIKGSKVAFDRVECDNGSTAAFNTNTWKLILEAEGKDKCSVYFRTTTDYIDDSGANSPELYQGLIPVTFDTNGNMKVADLTTDWYDYDDKRWANAVLVDYSNEEVKSTYFNEDGSLKTDIANIDVPMNYVLQMYVWIPRYKYQLFNAVKGESKPEQEIKIEFESGTLSTGEVSCTISDKGVERCENALNGNWYTHPAFKFGNTEIKGIWFGKFETGGTISDIKLLPSQSPIINTDISDMFNAIRNLEIVNKSKYNLNQSEIDTHMIKNMEWGAMAYLTQSKYGRCDGSDNCTEVTLNTTDRTGYADNSSYSWNMTNGMKASTTENMYGIYDVSGGLWEYVMGNMVDTNGTIISGNSKFNAQNSPNERYYDKYEYGTNAMDHSRVHLGDATRETMNAVGGEQGAWYGDWSHFVINTLPWFVRGGHKYEGTTAGVFASWGYSVDFNGYHTTRVVLTQQDGDE